MQPAISVLYAGWQVWDGAYAPVRVSGEIRASIEFVARTPPSPAPWDAQPGLASLRANRYSATARVAEAAEMVILDVGGLCLHRWVHPGTHPGPYVAGSTVQLELSLGLGVWGDADVTSNPIARHGAEYRWRVDRILKPRPGPEPPLLLDRADETTLDSGEYCLLECTLLAPEVGRPVSH